MEYELIVVGASWGGLHAVGAFLDGLGPQASGGGRRRAASRRGRQR